MKLIRKRHHDSEFIDLFDAMGRRSGYKIGDKADSDRFIAEVKASLSRAAASPILIHGHHAQAMFAYVAASLGACKMIREEDTGDIYAESNDVAVPDYRVLTKRGNEFFVEVKNCNDETIERPVRLQRSYVDALERYAAIFRRPVSIAIYWSRFRLWTMVSTPHLPSDGDDRAIDMRKATKINEMADLGDFMVATVPPLRMRILADPAKPRVVTREASGELRVEFTIGAVEMYCGPNRVEDPRERSIAFYLMFHGSWPEEEPRAEIRDNQLIAIDFVKAPAEKDLAQPFAMIDALSSMISTAYIDLTAEQSTVHRLTPNVEPGSLGLLIDPKYRGRHLPLWRFYQESNYDND